MQYDSTILFPVHCLEKKKNMTPTLCVFLLLIASGEPKAPGKASDYAGLQGPTSLSTWALSNSDTAQGLRISITE